MLCSRQTGSTGASESIFSCSAFPRYLFSLKRRVVENHIRSQKYYILLTLNDIDNTFSFVNFCRTSTFVFFGSTVFSEFVCKIEVDSSGPVVSSVDVQAYAASERIEKTIYLTSLDIVSNVLFFSCKNFK